MIGRWKLVGIAVLAVIATHVGAYQLGKYHQRQQMAVEAAQAIKKAIQNRAGINEKINDMDSVALCLELGGARTDCGQLRRLVTRYLSLSVGECGGNDSNNKC